jgi:hypothetical protein
VIEKEAKFHRVFINGIPQDLPIRHPPISEPEVIHYLRERWNISRRKNGWLLTIKPEPLTDETSE